MFKLKNNDAIYYVVSDIDECGIVEKNLCTAKDLCVNTAGNHTCVPCPNGYVPSVTGDTCVG